MTDKQLLQQLKNLKNIHLSDGVKNRNREVLLSQISNTFVKADKPFVNYLFNFKNVFSVMSQPLLVVAGVFVFLVGSLILGSGLYANSKPNDSLYIARVISEKARLNTTFSQSQRDALAMKFASDHAKDIATILMDPEFNSEDNQAQVEKLNTSFQNEISKVRTRIERNDNSSTNINSNITEGDIVKSASDLKDDTRMEISIPNQEIIEPSKNETPTKNTSSDVVDNSSNIKNNDDLKGKLEAEIDSSAEKLNGIKDGQKMIAEIEKLFAEKRYEEVIAKLSEVEKIIKK